MQVETEDPCLDGFNPNTLMPNQKHPAIADSTLTPNTIYRYILSGDKMVFSLSPTHANNAAIMHQTLLTKPRMKIKKLEPKPTQHIPSNCIYPTNSNTITGSPVNCNLQVRITDIPNYDKRTLNFPSPC